MKTSFTTKLKIGFSGIVLLAILTLAHNEFNHSNTTEGVFSQVITLT